MLRLFFRSAGFSLSLTAAVFLTGCGVTTDAIGGGASPQVSIGATQGNNYGGHAPLVGAHVFVLEGYQSAAGYYQKAKSLLSSGETGGPDFNGSSYPTTLDSSGDATNGDYYVTTDSKGDFSLPAYTCDIGYPVYLYASGGNPETIPAVTLTSFSINGGIATFNAATNLIYQGESVVIAGVPAAYNYLDGTYTVSSTGLGNTTFQVPIAHANVVGPIALATGTATQNTPIVSNPAVVNLAVLGICGSNGSTNFSSLPFVYVNEVSTVAAAYSLAGFFPPPGNASLNVAGAAAANLSVPSGDTLALTGLVDAANTAGQLYDIGGSNIGPGGDGETHIARPTTPAGGGTVPQTLIDTLGDVLANCVDSNNTSIVTANESSQCSTLFADTLSAGTTGTRPIDTATAAIDMAHNPWANANTLVTSLTGNYPFQPALATANDLSIGIQYTPAHVGKPQGIAVDGSGQVWYTNFSTGYLSAISPLGVVVYNVQHAGTNHLGYVAIDPSEAAWYGDISASELDKVNAAGVFVNAYDVNGLGQPYGIASDGIGHIYVEDINTFSVVEFNNAGAQTTTPANPLAGATTCGAGTWHADHIATDNAQNGYNVWYTSELGDFVCEVSTTTGALVHQTAVNALQNGSSYSPEFIGIDSNDTAWFPDQFHNGMNKVTSAGVITNPTGVTLSGGFGTAVDGADNIFVSSRTTADIAEYLGSTSAAVSTVRFEGGGNASIMTDPLNLAIDPSGNLWIADYTGNKIDELVGLAAPTYTPLSLAATVNKLGGKP